MVGERYRFRCRAQQPQESTAQWVSVLRQLASTCEYGDRCEEFIRDQVVEKTTSTTLRQRLLIEDGLILDKTLRMAESVETAAREARAMQSQSAQRAGPPLSAPVSAITASQARGGARPRPPAAPKRGGGTSSRGGASSRGGGVSAVAPQRAPPPTSYTPTSYQSAPQPTCFCCGLDHYAKDPTCPARNVTCHNCGKRGHYTALCKGRRSAGGARAVHALHILSVGTGQLRAPVDVGGKAVSMIVDTGSPVTVLPRNCVPTDYVITPSDKPLQAYGGDMLQVLGTCVVPIRYKGRLHAMKVFVVPHGSPLMGLDLMKVLGVSVVNNAVCFVSQAPSAIPAPEAEPEAAPAPIIGFEHRVTVNPEVLPVRQSLRRLPWSIRDKVSERIAELERSGVVESVKASEWVSPLVVTKKRNGDIRVCVDLRQANRAVVTDGYPLPHIEDMLHMLRGSKWFTKLDLKDAYHQVVLHPDSRPLTTFVTPDGLKRFCRIPFGLSSAGPCFQQIMEAILKGISGVVIYLDDVVVHASTKTKHDERVAAVEAGFLSANVRVNEPKCIRGVQTLPFLGYVVSACGIRIDPDRVAPLLHGPDPRDARELQAFLGSVSYHARFVPGFSTLVEPLRTALKADPFQWTQNHSSLVREMKRALADAPALCAFDPTLRTVLTCDASDVGCGARLSQLTPDGLEEVVSYASKTFSSAERSYSTVEKEALCCVWAVEKWRPYLWGRRFTLQTDHQALCAIYGPKGSNRVGRRVARWEARMAEYSFDVVYIRSAANLVADGLSRLPLPESEWHDDDDVQVAHLTVPCAIPEAEMMAVSAADDVLTEVRTRVSGHWPRSQRELTPELTAFYTVRDEARAVDLGPSPFQGRAVGRPT